MGVRIRRWGVGIATAVSTMTSAVVLAAAGFVGAFEDLPLMPGLTEAGDSQMVFETESGRIVQVVATGRTTRDEVLRFYEGTLPQLGWCRAAPGVFHREGEQLRLETDAGSGPTVTVRFTLSPSPASGCP